MTGTDRLAQLARIERLRRSGEARSIRLRAGVTASDVARALKVTPASVLAWESAKSRPRPDVAVAWLEALDRISTELPADDDKEAELVATGS
jgi:transcriptional regulator with XRE-family HTH domain